MFPYLIGGIVGVFLLHFLLQSRFATAELPTGQRILCIGGCFVLLCISDHWALLILAGCMAAFAMAHFIGQALLSRRSVLPSCSAYCTPPLTALRRFLQNFSLGWML